jgi:hypothetical protein
MTRAVVFLAAAMVAASLGLAAQDTSGATSNPNQKSNDAQRNITVTGCLNTLPSGGYSLSDEHGTTYALSGNADNLSSHTSQQIEVTGQQQLAMNASSGTSARSTIEVLSSRVIAEHCGAGSSAQANREPDASGVASLDDAVNNRQLPQTSTILPLLGLIGLGSLVAGFFARH